jgi:hypothetical protein
MIDAEEEGDGATKKRYPPLWHTDLSPLQTCHISTRNGSETNSWSKGNHESFLEARNNYWKAFPSIFYRKAPIRPLSVIIRDSLSIGQEVALVSLILSLHNYILFLEQHQNGDPTQQPPIIISNCSSSWRSASLICLGFLTLMIITFYGEEGVANRSTWMKNRTNRLHTRLPDALLLSVFLRLLSSVLRTLTASYSSDTVLLLATSGMAVHLLACNYTYANGGVYQRKKRTAMNLQYTSSDADQKSKVESSIKRPKFKGGTLSLNASFFSVTLLASRFHSNALAFIFVSTSVIAFAFYPDARHRMAKRKHRHSSTWTVCGTHVPLLEMLMFLSLSTSAYVSLITIDPITVVAKLYLLVQGMVCLVGPCTMYYVQRFRLTIIGPWDIASVSKNECDHDDEE